MSNVRRSLFVYFSATNSIAFLELGAALILARLLTPAEIGIYSVSAVLVGILQVLRNFGTGAYIVQEKELTPARLRAAFGVTLLMSWVLAPIIALASGVVAEFYREPGVKQVMLLLAVNMLLIPFGSVTMSCLQRDMRFGAVSRVELSSAFTHVTVGITLAFLGYGYMSLAWASLAGVVASIIGAAFYRPKDLPWLPGFAEARRILAFGAYSIGGSVIGTLNMGVPEVILGRMLGMEAVGLWSRAASVVRVFGRLIQRAVSGVALPYFSQQQTKADLKDAVLKAATYMTGLAWPFHVVVAILAFPVVRVLLGTQWDSAIPLVRIFALLAIFGAPFTLVYQVNVAAGKPQYNLFLELATLPVRAAVIVLAAPWGLTAVALAASITVASAVILNLVVLRTIVGLRIPELFGALYGSAGAASLAAIGPALVWWTVPLDEWRPWIVLAVGLPAGVAGWCVGLYLLKHPLWEELTGAVHKLRAQFR